MSAAETAYVRVQRRQRRRHCLSSPLNTLGSSNVAPSRHTRTHTTRCCVMPIVVYTRVDDGLSVINRRRSSSHTHLERRNSSASSSKRAPRKTSPDTESTGQLGRPIKPSFSPSTLLGGHFSSSSSQPIRGGQRQARHIWVYVGTACPCRLSLLRGATR